MGVWKDRWHTFTSFAICLVVVVFGTLLYPLVLLIVGAIALTHPLIVRTASRREESGPTRSSLEGRE